MQQPAGFPLRHLLCSLLLHSALPETLSRLLPAHSLEGQLGQLPWVLNFDGVHYFGNHYRFEPNFAFLPVFPALLAALKLLLGPPLAIFAIVLINKALFGVAAHELYQVLSLYSSRQTALSATLLFIYGPASIFYHVAYTESIFAWAALRATRLALTRPDTGTASAVGSICLATCLRSNGMFLSPVVGLEVLTRLGCSIKAGKIMTALVTGLEGAVKLLFIVSPFVIHQLFGYYRFCAQHSLQLCSSSLPNVYSYVQAKYWNVGLFSYYQLSNLPFILIGAPAVVVGIRGLWLYSSSWSIGQKGVYLSYCILLLVTLLLTNLQSATRFLSSHPLFYLALCSSALARRWGLAYCGLGMLLFAVGFPWT